MATIIDFPQIRHSTKKHVASLRADVGQLLSNYTMKAIVLALFEAATTVEDIAVIMPSFAKIAIDNNKK